MTERLWPRGLLNYLDSARCIPIEPGPFPQICTNCGGLEIMAVYVWSQGPTRAPIGKCKWLALDAPVEEIVTGADGQLATRLRPGPRTGWYQGELHVEPCPVCRGGQMQAFITANCGLTGPELEVSLSGFKTHGQLVGKQAALDSARALLGQNRQPQGFVTFLGEYGVGKSHLMKGIVNGFRAIDVRSRYTTMADLLADIREKFGDDHGSRRTEEIVDDLRKIRVLAIDEVDRVNPTSWAKETMARLLDGRYREQDSLLTILATNTPPDRLPAELGYLGSRMTGGIVIDVPGPDMRPGQGLKAQRELAAQQQEVYA